MSFLKSLCFGLASIISLRSISQEINVNQNSTLKIDGAFEDWKSIEGFSFPSSQDIWQVSGVFERGDLVAEVKLGTNEKGIFFFFQWADDVIDTKSIPKDSSILSMPSGARMDKMYLYDNIKIQLRTDSTNYVSWFNPAEPALQWNSLRKKIEGSWSSTPIPSPAYRYSESDSLIQLELLFTWEQVGTTNDELNLLVLINDTDLQDVDESGRLEEARSYISLSRKIILE